MSGAARIRERLAHAAELHRRVGDDRSETILRAAEMMRDAVTGGKTIWIFGNGGSASDAQHAASDLVGRFQRERRGASAVALTADTAVVTALGNDYGFEAVFARQIDALGRPGDVALGITTSGRSKNVNVALTRARTAGLLTIGLTGGDGGETGRIVDLHVNVPDPSTARVQEVHRTILHVMCELVEEAL